MLNPDLSKSCRTSNGISCFEHKSSTNWRDAFIYEAPTPVLGTQPVMAVRDARWKLIRTYDLHDPQRVAFTELYDLQSDPNEMRNLADEPPHAERVARMAERIAEHDRAIRQP